MFLIDEIHWIHSKSTDSVHFEICGLKWNLRISMKSSFTSQTSTGKHRKTTCLERFIIPYIFTYLLLKKKTTVFTLSPLFILRFKGQVHKTCMTGWLSARTIQYTFDTNLLNRCINMAEISFTDTTSYGFRLKQSNFKLPNLLQCRM